MTIGIGTGTTVAFSGGISFSAEVLSFKIDGQEVPVIDTTHLGTTDYRTKIFGNLSEPGAVEIEANYNPASPPPVAGTLGTLTITWPDNSTLTGTGAIVKASSETKEEEKMTGSFTFQFDGQTGPTYA